MSKVQISMENIVIDADDLPYLEQLMARARRLVKYDYQHKVDDKYIEYLSDKDVFEAVGVKLMDSGKAAVMEMYYDEHVKNKD